MGLTLASAVSAFYQNYHLRQYGQSVIWLQRITERTPGATTTASWEPNRQQVASFSDGSYGVGFFITDSGGRVRMGYLAPQSVQVGINDRLETREWDGQGWTFYEVPAVLFQSANAPLDKGDVLVLDDGRRFVVGDRLKPYQVFGTTVLEAARLEARDSQDIIYTIPTV